MVESKLLSTWTYSLRWLAGCTRGSVPLKSGVNFKKGTLLFYVDDTEAHFQSEISEK